MSLRKHKKLKFSSLQHENFADTATDQSEELEENIEWLAEALNELKPQQQECLQLFFLENKSYKEIEELTGLDFKQIKSYIQNGKRNLHIKWKATHEDESAT